MKKKATPSITPGRPPTPASLRTKALSVRLTPAEHAELVRRAYADEDGLGNYLVVRALGRRFS